ncbi:MAG: hypothetical protein LBG60_13145 [Bifidobacteriaceae bacterium]|jgi:hypothetical protein|nr:hypothetical protein [Bifidobacteriaceae bacterium]
MRLPELSSGFFNPPHQALPGVYWYVLDGTLNREGITKDLAAMSAAGLGQALFVEVDLGLPRGPVKMLSPEWLDLVAHAVRESERLGIDLVLAAGPGWAGSGGPWVDVDQSMQHLVASETKVRGNGRVQRIVLEAPEPKRPFFVDAIPEACARQRERWLEDVAVLAVPAGVTRFGGEPTPTSGRKDWDAYWELPERDARAFYYRQPYSSAPETERFFPTAELYPSAACDRPVSPSDVLDLTGLLVPGDGLGPRTLEWDAPAGEWTVLRFASRSTGAGTRPAPLPGWGFESDKLNETALTRHLDHYLGQIFRRVGIDTTPAAAKSCKPGGVKGVHIDSWEMGAQNWTADFREEFRSRRGYDPQPYYPVYLGLLVGDREISERFLWDLRLTVQELIVERHVSVARQFANRHGLALSIEAYDMTPAADLELFCAADVQQAEFWGQGNNTAFSVTEAVSAARLKGQAVIPAESFTSYDEDWGLHPGAMKNQGDWAFSAGINRFLFHVWCHQPFPDDVRPGITLGPIGVHWDRNQTWWDMARDYHRYVARCSHMLQSGRAVADILYLTPEGAPHVFYPPADARTGSELLPDQRGHNFDACPPSQLAKAAVEAGHLVFPGGARYRLLVLPNSPTMTPELLETVVALTDAGASVLGLPPDGSPSLADLGAGDAKVRELATLLWGPGDAPAAATARPFGKGRVIWGEELRADGGEYPSYAVASPWVGVPEDFTSDGPIRHTHRIDVGFEAYFVSNRTAAPVSSTCLFRTSLATAWLWHPVTGERRPLHGWSAAPDGRKQLGLRFEPYESYFVVFADDQYPAQAEAVSDFPEYHSLRTLPGPWQVSFDPGWGGPEEPVRLAELADWSHSGDESIRHFSGRATYSCQFELDQVPAAGLWLDVGRVEVMASVTLNGHPLGALWTAPYRVDATAAARPGTNTLEIAVANLWANRLIGDERLPADGIESGHWPEWLDGSTPRTSGRQTFATYRHFAADSPLRPSGLLGPVSLLTRG